MAKPVLGYWDFRGLAQPIRLLLVHAGVDFEDKRYPKRGNGLDTEWMSDKYSLGFDFPNLPYYIDGDVKLTQSITILRYIGGKYKLDGNTEQEKIRISLLEQQTKDFTLGFVRLLFNADFESAKADYLKNLPDQLKAFANFIGNRNFVAGENVSYVDFFFYENLVRAATFAPDVMAQFEVLKKYITRIESLPKVAQYLKKVGPQPFLFDGLKWNDKY